MIISDSFNMNMIPESIVNDVILVDNILDSADVLSVTPIPPGLNLFTGPMQNNFSQKSLSAENIMSYLKQNKTQWNVIDATDKKSTCWQHFGFPVFKVGDKKQVFDQFVSCKNCFITYAYSSSTRNMNKHIQICDASNGNQTRLSYKTTNNSTRLVRNSSSSLVVGNNKILDSHRKSMKNLLAEWICSNLRPFSIVEDAGLTAIIDEAIRIGIQSSII